MRTLFLRGEIVKGARKRVHFTLDNRGPSVLPAGSRLGALNVRSTDLIYNAQVTPCARSV